MTHISEESYFHRSNLLLGPDAMARLATVRVLIVGTGGVGSWCAEGLVRTGITHLTIVDNDRVCPSNVNRQLMATRATVGRVKVDALRDRLLTINPDADITALAKVYSEETADEFDLASYDYIVDAIDSLADKMLLIRRATATRAVFFSSMGAALKMDPTRVAVAEFWKVRGCPLAAALRRRFKREGALPRRKFKCVYSEELLRNAVSATAASADVSAAPRVNGSLVHITATFGFTLAGLIVQDLWRRAAETPAP